ncbi:MAG TPA: radical SAM protein [Ignavibacteriaceae bacterium]|nr:radical SAM protein [Ignavibacteriaceae bacterium]
MVRHYNISVRENSSIALNPQGSIDQYGFPLTLNPTIGCHFACKYCYSPVFVKKQLTDRRKDFFEEVIFKKEIPALLEKELEKYSVLPNHLKRVQINETSDYYLPRIINGIQDGTLPDIMLEVLNIFQRQWDKGNKWMLHFLTKSPLIRFHLDKLIEMKHMVQVEMSIATIVEDIRRKIEVSAPSTQQRFDTIKLLSDNGIFVRVMAMPFYGDYNDVLNIKKVTAQYGAKAFKNKGLNYFDWDELKNLSYQDLIADKVSRVQGRKDIMYEDLNYKSGEDFLVNGKPTSINLLMPIDRKWAAVTKMEERIKPMDQKIINCGYGDINSEDWGYIK